MTTVERINRLLLSHGLEPITPDTLVTTGTPAQNILDVLDQRAGMSSMVGNDRAKQQNYVGARLARLERRREGTYPFYFWLGRHIELCR